MVRSVQNFGRDVLLPTQERGIQHVKGLAGMGGVRTTCGNEDPCCGFGKLFRRRRLQVDDQCEYGWPR